jgi:hypothetical protein
MAYTPATLCPFNPAAMTLKGKTRLPFNTGGALGESGGPVSSLPSVDHSFVPIEDREENLEGRAGEKPVEVQEVPTKRTSGNRVFLAEIIMMINFRCFESVG